MAGFAAAPPPADAPRRLRGSAGPDQMAHSQQGTARCREPRMDRARYVVTPRDSGWPGDEGSAVPRIPRDPSNRSPRDDRHLA